MWIWHFCSHEEFEMLVKIDVGLSKPDLHDTSLGLVLLFKQNWINSWIDAFFEILNE